MELTIQDVISAALDTEQTDRCLYVECRKVIPPGGGARIGNLILDKRYCDEYCLDSMRCWINFQMMLGHSLMEWGDAIRKRYEQTTA